MMDYVVLWLADPECGILFKLYGEIFLKIQNKQIIILNMKLPEIF